MEYMINNIIFKVVKNILLQIQKYPYSYTLTWYELSIALVQCIKLLFQALN